MKCGRQEPKHLHRLRAVHGHSHLESGILQQAFEHRAVLPLIVDNQDAVFGFAGLAGR